MGHVEFHRIESRLTATISGVGKIAHQLMNLFDRKVGEFPICGSQAHVHQMQSGSCPL
jgi:hypothetical protein